MPDRGTEKLQQEILKELRDHQHRIEYLETLEPLQRHRSEVGCEELEFPAEPFGICNGSFEMGPTDRFPVAEGWNLTYYEGGESELVADTYDGSLAAKGGNPNTGGGSNWAAAHLYPINEDTNYEISFAAKSENSANLVVYFNCFDVGGAFLGPVTLFNGIPAAAWEYVTHRIGPNGDNNWLANTRTVRLIIATNSDVTQTDAWSYVDMIRFRPQHMADNRFIHLIESAKGIVDEGTNWVHNVSGAYTQDPFSPVTVTLTEPGYIHYHYVAYTLQTQAAQRAFHHACRIFIGGVQAGESAQIQSAAFAANINDGLSISGIAGPYVPGAWVVDGRWSILVAGDTVTVLGRHMSAFWSREN